MQNKTKETSKENTSIAEAVINTIYLLSPFVLAYFYFTNI